MRGRHSAGRSTLEVFRAKRRQTIRQNWRDVAGLLALIVSFGVWVLLETDDVRRTFAAFALGAAFTIFVVGWMLGFDARLLRWQWGAAGERWTEEELRRLGPEWHVVHDIPDGEGNWDHVAVGPTGVYVIDSKNYSEPAQVDGSGLRVGRIRVGATAARASAARMKDAIQHEAGRAIWVQSVVVVWGELKGGVVERDRVLYVTGSELVETLRSRPVRLRPTEVALAAQAVRAISGAAGR